MSDYALIGEARGAEEELEFNRTGKETPFIGAAGQILNSTLAAAGIKREDCFITNVFNLRPPNNKIKTIMVPKTKGAQGWAPFRMGQYLDPNLLPEIFRLHKEIKEASPKIIICLGAVALWAITQAGALGPHRGHLHWWEGFPMIPTYHPARVLRQYYLKSCLIGDLIKARDFITGELKPAELNYIDLPTMQDIQDFSEEAEKSGIISVDIETLPAYRAITCIGFGLPHRSICVPFFHESFPAYSYWITTEQELEALMLCKKIIENKKTIKVFHKMNYDIPWLSTVLGIETKGETSDTLVMHAGKVTELPHSLSDLTATFGLYPPWKALWASNKESDSTTDNGGEE